MQDANLLTQLLTELSCEKIQMHDGNNMKCTCPLHVDKDPSFYISLDEFSKWYCFGCQKKGINIKGLVRQASSIQGKDFSSWEDSEKTRSAGHKEYSLARKRRECTLLFKEEEEQRAFSWKEFEPLTREVPRYALERGVSVAQAKKWRLGMRESRLFIPVFDHQGIFVGFSERATLPDMEPRYKHVKGFPKSKYFYGEEFIDTSVRTVCLVEGFFDLWSLERAGVKNVLATMGTDASDHQLLKIVKWADDVIIFPDRDEAGLKALEKWTKSLKDLGKRVVPNCTFIAGKKDCGDWTRKETSYVLQKISENYHIKIPIAE